MQSMVDASQWAIGRSFGAFQMSGTTRLEAFQASGKFELCSSMHCINHSERLIRELSRRLSKVSEL